MVDVMLLRKGRKKLQVEQKLIMMMIQSKRTKKIVIKYRSSREEKWDK